jgi:hypothetical protein
MSTSPAFLLRLLSLPSSWPWNLAWRASRSTSLTTARLPTAACVAPSTNASGSAPTSPFIHISVISSREARYATAHAATTSLCSAGHGSNILVKSFWPLESGFCVIAATPPVTTSTQSMPASVIAALATVMHPASTFNIPQPLPSAFPPVSESPHQPSSSPSRMVTTTSTPLFGQRSPMITPRNALSRCTPKSRSVESRM